MRPLQCLPQTALKKSVDHVVVPLIRRHRHRYYHHRRHHRLHQRKHHPLSIVRHHHHRRSYTSPGLRGTCIPSTRISAEPSATATAGALPPCCCHFWLACLARLRFGDSLVKKVIVTMYHSDHSKHKYTMEEFYGL